MIRITHHLSDLAVFHGHQHTAIRFANMTSTGVDFGHGQAFVMYESTMADTKVFANGLSY